MNDRPERAAIGSPMVALAGVLGWLTLWRGSARRSCHRFVLELV